ncbi:MAG: 30S ribosomal protein S17 [SAR324 cluster bacterium]|nr:30S ribosomal protein S17 [SAR324 cluster bacterium]MCZ6532529.1 30S ribosomal protein S17 [SAR324 cluster bacterium]MCZ6558889.1 30S ribosomal protein S17 [SAR324 cluster bacterium]MCZ6627074.1 30S ribosomal protein S17 [SAR324 cluster bacterium]MCZ6646365.1 30S ribosomal protein S17 [SAR324 cluster bacterium]
MSEQPEKRKLRKSRQGVIVSDKLDRSIVVRVDRTMRHPLYKKVIRRSKKYMAHDQENSGKVGDLVRIMECRPISRRKRWRLVEVMTRAES